MTAAHIELTDVYKAFGPKSVLNGVNLSVPRGHSLVVIGGSGTGKSVMLKCVLGIVQPDSGSIRIGGEEVVGLSGSSRDKVLSRIRNAVPGRGAVRLAFGLAERGLRPDPGQEHAPARGEGDRHHQARAGRARPRGGGALSGRIVGRHAEARRSCPGHRRATPRSSFSTSRPPASIRSWPTSSTT